MFVGRKTELKELNALWASQNAQLVILKGRRRIGKSRLIEEFGRQAIFYVFSGVPPSAGTTAQTQRNEFARQLSQQTGLPEIQADDWSKLFILLSERIGNKQTVVLLDEISWMGSLDPDFLGKLKTIWDLYFKKKPRLILVLCGSVSAWIEKNIIRHTGFLGRPSLYMTLEELSLSESGAFWANDSEVSAFEKLKILSVTGGVPRYLELVDTSKSAELNIQRMCFSKNGPLVQEFEYIFSDIFSNRTEIYKHIVQNLVDGPKTADELADLVKIVRTGTFDTYLQDLCLSGFITRDYIWHFKTSKISKLSRYRLKDNYVRFYLKYILPNKYKIEKNLANQLYPNSLSEWPTIMGLQFENLVIHNPSLILEALEVSCDSVVFNNPYFQRPTLRQSGCQIDYLIQTRFDTLYLCEIKFSKNPIGLSVVAPMQEKCHRLKVPRYMSKRPVLIHVNGITEELQESRYFSHIIDFGKFL